MAVRPTEEGGGSRPSPRPRPRSQGPAPRNNAGQPIGAGGVTGYLNQIRSQQMMGPQPGDIPMVYLGTSDAPSRGAGAAFRDPAGFGAVGSVQTASLAELMSQFDNWSEKRKREMAEKMAIAGLFSQSPYQDESLSEFVARMTLGDVQQAYGSLLQAASARFQAGQRITPEQLLQQHIDYNKSAANAAGVSIFGGGGAGGDFTGTKTQTSKHVDIFSAQDARGLARATLRRELDRDPTEAEFEDFVAALQAKQRANPTRTTTTSTFEDGDLVDQSSVSRGGLTSAGIEEFATRQAQSNPGWAEWQAAGVLFPSVLASLGAGVLGV